MTISLEQVSEAGVPKSVIRHLLHGSGGQMPIGVSVERREVTLYPSYVFLLTPVGLRKSLKVSYHVPPKAMWQFLRWAHIHPRTLRARINDHQDCFPRGAWVAQWVKHSNLGFRSGRDLTVHEFKPRIGLHADSTEPAWDSLSPFLSLPLPCSRCPSLKINK